MARKKVDHIIGERFPDPHSNGKVLLSGWELAAIERTLKWAKIERAGVFHRVSFDALIEKISAAVTYHD